MGSEHDEPAAGAEAAQALAEDRATHMFEHDIDAAPSISPELLSEGSLRVVADDLCTEIACALHLCLAADGREHLRPDQPGNSDRGAADATPSCGDEYRLA